VSGRKRPASPQNKNSEGPAQREHLKRGTARPAGGAEWQDALGDTKRSGSNFDRVALGLGHVAQITQVIRNLTGGLAISMRRKFKPRSYPGTYHDLPRRPGAFRPPMAAHASRRLSRETPTRLREFISGSGAPQLDRSPRAVWAAKIAPSGYWHWFDLMPALAGINSRSANNACSLEV
jgi:hypothetical protein